ncbi:ISAs1 family transposase [Streptomyces sp. NPDC096176]|uniref:ISAs1 family transposase n=1 Tax=Streptomyces sp. NPDC096176 TaxID=3366079 RepID=UPI0037F22206
MTGDALRTQRDHARFLVETKKAHYTFTVKRNQKNHYEQLRTLPWGEATAKFYDRTKGHGRLETRVVQAVTVTDLGVNFPHAAQVAKVVRHRTDTKTGKRSRETGLRDHRPDQPPGAPGADREDLQGTLVIENRLHFVRDTAFREDASKIRTGHGSENMATLRSFAINHLRTDGHTNIAAALRTTALRPYERPPDPHRRQMTCTDP